MALGQRALRHARRPAEQGMKAAAGHGQTGGEIEVAHVQLKTAVPGDAHEFFPDQIGVFGRAIRGQPHDFIFAGIDLETQVVGEGGIEQAEGMREVNLLQGLKLAAPAQRERGGGPFAHAIERQHGGALKRRGIEGAGRVREVMLGK